MTSRQYDAIDEGVSKKIVALHKAHPKLGRHGLLKTLKQEDIHVDPQELLTFMAAHHIKPEREWRPWKWGGLPDWYIGRRYD